MHILMPYFIFTVVVSLFSPLEGAERCSKLSGKCFEWPIIPHGTTLKKIATTGVWSKPAGKGPFPAVVIVESCGGPKPAVDKMWPDFFNSLGFATYTPRILQEFGVKYCPGIRFVISNSNRAKMLRIVYSALDELSEKPFVKKDKIGVIGFSLGGILIRDAGEIKNLKSPLGNAFKYAIPVYGSCTLFEGKGDKIPTLIIQAEKERTRKRQLCIAVRDKNFANVTYHEISGAYHAFDDSTITSIKRDVAKNEMLYSSKAVKEAKSVIRNFLKKIN